jgi:ABC-type transporter Mla subunit MlaD
MRVIQMLETLMATIDQVVQDVADESTAIDSVSTLVAGLKQQLADALSGANIPPAVQSKIDAVFAGLEANKSKLATALTTAPPAATPSSSTPPAAPATPAA